MLKGGKHKFKYTMDTTENGDSEMNLEMLQLKLWVKPQVFISMSKYLVTALERLSIQTTPTEVAKVDVKKKASTAVMKIQIHIDESLILILNEKISDKVIVL